VRHRENREDREDREDREGRILVGLAMNWQTCRVDGIRAKNYAQDRRWSSVVTVNDGRADNSKAPPHILHMECDFKTPRGIKSLCGKLRREFGPNAHYEIALDFFFLINSYYRLRYGMNWTNKKIALIKSLLPNATILLPEDTVGSVKTMLDKNPIPHRRLSVASGSKTPFVALAFEDNVTGGLRRDHRASAKDQMSRYITGFYKF